MTAVQSLRGNWNYPTAIRFGAGRIAELPDACREAGIAKPLLITDKGLAKLPVVTETLALLAAAGLPAGTLRRRAAQSDRRRRRSGRGRLPRRRP